MQKKLKARIPVNDWFDDDFMKKIIKEYNLPENLNKE